MLGFILMLPHLIELCDPSCSLLTDWKHVVRAHFPGFFQNLCLKRTGIKFDAIKLGILQ